MLRPQAMNLVTKILTLSSLILLWISLNGINLSTGGLALLIVIPTLSYLLALYMGILPGKLKLKVNFVWYCLWLIKEIFKSTIDVVKIIWSKDMNLSENIEWLEARSNDETYLTIYGNSITLTPGTVTLDIKNNMLLVHSLKKAAFEDLQRGEMENRLASALSLKED
jgi:multicomponent Na+:H+ antiporter subunit E